MLAPILPRPTIPRRIGFSLRIVLCCERLVRIESCDTSTHPKVCRDEPRPTLQRLCSTTPTSPVPHSFPSALVGRGGRGRQGPENRRALALPSLPRRCTSGPEPADRSNRHR